MSDYVNDALLGASPYKKQQDETKGLVAKWDKTGLLDGLNEEFQKTLQLVVVLEQALLEQLVQRNGLVSHFHWFVESLVRLQLKTLYQFNQ